MSENEIRRVLLYFEQVVEEHHVNLDELENYLELPIINTEKLEVLLRRLRRTRRELLNGIKIIVDNIDNVKDEKLKEEALGLMNYFYIVGFNDEENALKKAMSKDNSLSEIINSDLDMLNKIRSMIVKFIF
ncbi:MAG: hypothetical protein RXR43_07640 [Sulfolobus sp.]